MKVEPLLSLQLVIASHTHYNGYYQETKQNKCGEIGPLVLYYGNIKWFIVFVSYLQDSVPCGCKTDLLVFLLFCCCSVTLLCLTLCDPRDCSMPGFPVLHHLLELAQTHVHWVGIISNHLIIYCVYCPLFLLPSIYPSIRVFSNKLAVLIKWPAYWSFSLSNVLPMNIQGWFPLGLTGLISLQSKDPPLLLSAVNSLSGPYYHSIPCLITSSILKTSDSALSPLTLQMSLTFLSVIAYSSQRLLCF